MTITLNETTSRKPLRLWPGVVIVILQWLLAFGVPQVAPDAELFSLPIGLLGVLGGVVGGLAIVIWWLFFSRAPWSERLGALVLMIVAVIATRLTVHESIRGGMMGNVVRLLRPGPQPRRRRLGGGHASSLCRSSARVAGRGHCVAARRGRWCGQQVSATGSEFHWRWTETPEQRLLAQVDDEPKPPSPAPAETPKEPSRLKPKTTRGTPGSFSNSEDPARRLAWRWRRRKAGHERLHGRSSRRACESERTTPAEWPGFRGPERDGIIRGVRITTDWSASPPVEMWRRPIGPGWSSFAVRGDLLYTQEQRGDDEIVACYRVSTGEPVWRHRDRVRFWESTAAPVRARHRRSATVASTLWCDRDPKRA